MPKIVARLIPTLFWFAAVASAGTAQEFGASRSPAEPILEVNRAPDLCAKAHAALLAAHRGPAYVLNGATHITQAFTRVDLRTLEPPAGSPAETLLQRADLDLDGVGRLNTVVFRTRPFNWKGDWHYGDVFSSPAAFDAVSDAWKAAAEGESVAGARAFYPDAKSPDGKPVAMGNQWASPELFTFGERYYLVYTPNQFEAQALVVYSVYRLRADGVADLACTLTQNRIEGQHYRFETTPDIEAWLNVVRRIGYPGPDSGTMHAESQHLAAATLGEQIAAARPWAIAGRAESAADPRDYHRYGPRLDHFLDSWSQEEPWARREYQSLKALMPAAVRAYADYLRREFGVTAERAPAAAADVLQGLLAQYILVPAQFEEYEQMPEWRNRTAAPLVVRDRAAFERLLEEAKGQGAKAAAEYSWLLPMAVEWPYALDRLLALGADPNVANAFGKTALMTAAHLNRPDAVRKLLKAGARVDARTVTLTNYAYDVERGGRTALMYAGENASPLVIHLLRKAGANPRLADSRDATFAAYLEWNPRFTPAEREALKNQPEAAISTEASFDCGKATAAVDRIICQSEVLRVFDGEIAVAYARLKERRGEPLVVEQRAWLRERNRACGTPPDADCLAEVLRTRVRMLHERLSLRAR